MRRTRQDPLEGTGGRIRYGRRAAVSSRAPTVSEGRLPLRFQTVIDPGQVILHVRVPGEPIPKGRPRWRAFLQGTGKVLQGKIIPNSGDLRLITQTYTPEATRDAEELWRLIINTRRRLTEPVPHPVGVLAFFQTTGRRADGDNLFKLVADAMNGTLLDDDQQIAEHHVHVLRRCTEPGTDLLVWMTNRRIPGGET